MYDKIVNSLFKALILGSVAFFCLGLIVGILVGLFIR